MPVLGLKGQQSTLGIAGISPGLLLASVSIRLFIPSTPGPAGTITELPHGNGYAPVAITIVDWTNSTVSGIITMTLITDARFIWTFIANGVDAVQGVFISNNSSLSTRLVASADWTAAWDRTTSVVPQASDRVNVAGIRLSY